MIDLHSHTTASDGVHPPEGLVRLAAAAGVTVLAVTDHDTTAAIAAATRAAEEQGGALRIVPGIEISSLWKGKEIHVLGHFIDPADETLCSRLAVFREARENRMAAMVERCRSLGLDVTLEEVEARRTGPGTLGRPHLARLLVEKGYARDFQGAFDKWIGKGSPAWVERAMPDAAEAIALIRGAGGCATVAHPALSGLVEKDLRALAAAGMVGLEADHPAQTPDVRKNLRLHARTLGLCATAGSDYHADETGGLRLGTEGMEPGEFAGYEALATRSTMVP